MTAPARADSAPDWLSEAVLKSLFPDALYAGPLSGDPPSAAVYGAGARLGYIFATSDIADTVGFSGAPFTIAVGLDLDGIMIGVKLIAHAEPILDYNTLTESLAYFIAQYQALDYGKSVRIAAGGQPGEIDGISTATISARAFHSAIILSARSVARSRGLRSGASQAVTVDLLHFEPLRWSALVKSGAVQQLTIRGKTASDSTTLNAALLTPTSIGRNILSQSAYDTFVASQSPQDLIIALMADGPYSFVGKKVFETGTFERIRIEQDNKLYPLVRQVGYYRYLPFIKADDAPSFSEIGLFRVPAESGINVLEPWDLVVSIGNEIDISSSTAETRLRYDLPKRFVLQPIEPTLVSEPGSSQIQAAWQAQRRNIAILLAALSVLVLILFLMQPLSQRPRLYSLVRTGYLLFTLLWLGWIAGAQLSVINPIAWVQTLTSNAGVVMVLSDPLLVVLTLFVLVSFVFWGRGVFCGWLCPFGALQELLARFAIRAKLPQVRLSHAAHRRLWPVKYIVLAVLIAAAFHAPATLGLAAEIEPFKTVISLKFDRAWPFVLYAVLLLGVGLFVERAFCRFLCPLGAMMVIGGKLRLRNPLKRRTECGSPCQLCTRRCPIQAIAPNGKIDMDECFYCLDCQVIYHDDHQCPPLVNRRRRPTAAPTSEAARQLEGVG